MGLLRFQVRLPLSVEEQRSLLDALCEDRDTGQSTFSWS